jgi:hypothetical protein
MTLDPIRASAAGAALLASILAACDGGGVVAANDETMALAQRAARAKAWVATDSEPVSVSIEAPATARPGAMVPIRVRVHNGTTRPLTIGLGERQAFDVLVAQTGTRADSGAVWSPMKLMSTGRDAVTMNPLPAGRDTTFDTTWPGTDDAGHSVPPGRYRMRAVVAAELLKTRQIWTDWRPIDVR